MNGQTVRNTIITSLVSFDGYGKEFAQIQADLARIDKAMPHATGAEKLAKFEADAKIIFDEAILPVGGRVLNALLNLALIYLHGVNPGAAMVADVLAPGVEAGITKATTSKVS